MNTSSSLLATCVALLLLQAPAVAQEFAPMRKENVPAAPFRPVYTALPAADLDGDGDVDVLWADGRIFENAGTGSFRDRRPGTRIVLSGTVTALADMDADGDRDAVESDPLNDRLVLHDNDGTGRFTRRGTIVTGGGSSVALDIDGDGDLDLLQQRSLGARVLRNPGALPFQEVPGALPPSSLLLAIRSADLDGDGDQDLLVAGMTVNGVGLGVWMNDGTGRFTDLTAAALPAGLPPSLVCWTANVDRDGDVDVLFHSGRLHLLINDGTGRFADATASRLPVIGQPPSAFEVYARDFDRDGDVDLAQPGVPLLLNDGTGRFTYDQRSKSEFPDRIDVPLDAEGDGDQDLLVRGEVLAWNDGSGLMQPAFGAIGDGGTIGFGHAADLDGDGDVDLIAGPGRILANDGRGAFAPIPATAMPTEPAYWNAVFTWDADGDGDLDVMIPHDSGTVLWENTGAMTFRRASVSIPFLGVYAVLGGQAVPSDVDADGDLDLLYVDFAATQRLPWLLRNDGTGNLTVETGAVAGIIGRARTIAVGDVDADGDVDLAVSEVGRGAPECWIFRNDGTGAFGNQTLVRDVRSIVELADIDGDGDLDLLSADGGTLAANMVLAVHHNDGTGTFVSGPSFAQVTRSAALRLRTPDLDGDGDIDIVVDGDTLHSEGPWIRFFVNDGSGALTPIPVDVELDEIRLRDVTDLDGDGDVDLVGATALHANLHRQVRAPFAARLGFAFPLEVSARAGAGAATQATVFAAPRLRTTPLTLPTFGTWFLDELVTHPVLTLLVPTAGSATLPLAVPNVSAIAGGSVHFQAALLEPGGALRLTNATSDVLFR